MKKIFFPWRSYLSFFSLCLAFEVFVGLIYFEFSRLGNWSLETWICVIVLTALVGALFFFLPLRRVLLKATRLSNKRRVWGLIRDEEKLFQSTRGIFPEFDHALNSIRQKIKRRGVQLAHERAEAETLIAFLDDALVTFSPDGQIKYFNSAFATLFFQPQELSKLSLQESLYISEVTNELELDGIYKQVFEERKVLRTQIFLTASGKHFSVLISPLKDDRTHEVYGALALFHDISEFKRVEKLRLEFVENASHELRTPLTSIKGFVATLKEDFDSGRYDQISYFLEIVSKNVNRLGELVNDMLTLSQLENHASLRKSLVHLDALSAEVIEKLAPLASEKKIFIQFRSTVPVLFCDEDKVERVLMNLVGNAIKYVQENGKIEIVWESNPDNILLIVKDNGPGVATEHLGRLFERFYRVDKGRSRGVGGTGLGLAIVKHIMQSHGGRVFAESEPGQGAAFICEFPLTPAVL